MNKSLSLCRLMPLRALITEHTEQPKRKTEIYYENIREKHSPHRSCCHSHGNAAAVSLAKRLLQHGRATRSACGRIDT